MVCILATSKIWNPALHENLEKRTSKEFISVTSPIELTANNLAKIQPEYIFFPHWSYIIPPEIFKYHECIIFHMTDLPYGRGGTPLQHLILNKANQTKISALRCEAEIDSGPIYLKKSMTLEGKAQEIYYRATLIIEDMIAEIIAKKLTPRPQQGTPVIFQRRTPDQGNIVELNELETVYNYIRMLDAEHYSAAFIETENLRFEFTDAKLGNDKISAHVTIQLKREENEKNCSNSSTS